mgnify:FL=1
MSLQGLAVAAAPLQDSASGMTLVQFFGFLNIFIGIFLTLALILYGAAVIIYFTRFGNPNRAESLDLVELGLTILFILIVVLGVVQYFQRHPANMAYIIGTIVFLLVVGLIIYAYSGGEKKPAGPPGPPGR